MKEKNVSSNKKPIKNKSDELSEREIKELMHHSSYKRHRGAVKQVK